MGGISRLSAPRCQLALVLPLPGIPTPVLPPSCLAFLSFSTTVLELNAWHCNNMSEKFLTLKRQNNVNSVRTRCHRPHQQRWQQPTLAAARSRQARPRQPPAGHRCQASTPARAPPRRRRADEQQNTPTTLPVHPGGEELAGASSKRQQQPCQQRPRQCGQCPGSSLGRRARGGRGDVNTVRRSTINMNILGVRTRSDPLSLFASSPRVPLAAGFGTGCHYVSHRVPPILGEFSCKKQPTVLARWDRCGSQRFLRTLEPSRPPRRRRTTSFCSWSTVRPAPPPPRERLRRPDRQ